MSVKPVQCSGSDNDWNIFLLHVPKLAEEIFVNLGQGQTQKKFKYFSNQILNLWCQTNLNIPRIVETLEKESKVES